MPHMALVRDASDEQWWGMAQQDREWELELEESAQGTDSFTAPGGAMQADEARQAAKEWSAGSEGNAQGSSTRVEKARVRRHLLGDALHGLERAVAGPSEAEEWVGGVTAALAELRRALDEHIEVTEGPGGLLEEVRDVAPRLSGEILLIETEHEELVDLLAKAEASLEQSTDPKAIRNRAMALLPRLSMHRQRGADLVYDAYNVDIAASD
jgi:hypothetical protein